MIMGDQSSMYTVDNTVVVYITLHLMKTYAWCIACLQEPQLPIQNVLFQCRVKTFEITKGFIIYLIKLVLYFKAHVKISNVKRYINTISL